MYSNALDDDSKIHLFGYTVHSHSKHAYGKRKWYKKRRAGLSFFMVIAFFAVFVLIILIEIFLIDGKSTAHGVSEAGSDLQYIGYNHIDDAMSEFDDVNDEYSIESAVFGRNRFREKHRGKLQSRCAFKHWSKKLFISHCSERFGWAAPEFRMGFHIAWGNRANATSVWHGSQTNGWHLANCQWDAIQVFCLFRIL